MSESMRSQEDTSLVFGSLSKGSLERQPAVITEAIQPGRTGKVHFVGTWWSARCERNVHIAAGEIVHVIGRENLTLIVEPTFSAGYNNVNKDAISQSRPTGYDEIKIGAIDDLPLLDLFTRLQEAGLPLGIDEYCLLVRALQEGFGTADRAALADLCRTLWVKSLDDEHLFNYHFEQLVEEPSVTTPTPDRQEKRSQLDSSDSQRDDLLKRESSRTSELSNTTTSPPVSVELMEIGDEIQVAEAVQVSIQRDNEAIPNRFTQNDEYFPVTRRQMKQSWRHLRRLVREGLPTELDVAATITLAVQHGTLLEPVLVPRRVNRTELLLLLDQKGSMVPFHALSQRLVETAQRGGRLGRAGVYYFHNCPARFLYRDPTRQQAEPLPDVLARLKPDRSAVLIFSDAGAARGGYNEERLDLTKQFLSQLKQSVRHVAWLNPMPQKRWMGTIVEEITELVPMFEMSRRGMDEAINTLQGKR